VLSYIKSVDIISNTNGGSIGGASCGKDFFSPLNMKKGERPFNSYFEKCRRKCEKLED